jgi:hypothetical protein
MNSPTTIGLDSSPISSSYSSSPTSPSSPFSSPTTSPSISFTNDFDSKVEETSAKIVTYCTQCGFIELPIELDNNTYPIISDVEAENFRLKLYEKSKYLKDALTVYENQNIVLKVEDDSKEGRKEITQINFKVVGDHSPHTVPSRMLELASILKKNNTFTYKSPTEHLVGVDRDEHYIVLRRKVGINKQIQYYRIRYNSNKFPRIMTVKKKHCAIL